MRAASITERTYRFECWRALSSGVLEAAAGTFLLLIAVRWYAAGSVAKAILAAGSSAGLLVSPMTVWFTARAGLPVAQAGSRILAAGAIAMLLAAVVPFLPIFVIGTTLGLIASSACVPLVTQMYQENYPAETRGRLFSRTFMIRIATAAVVSGLGGWLLRERMESFRWLVGLFGLALGFGSWCLAQCPSTPLLADTGAHPLRGWRHVSGDPLFGRTLISWMLMGFANLMMLPLRIEYLANPKYHLALEPDVVAMLTGVIPHAARFVMSPVWGHLFDRMNFFGLRMTLNVGFALGILGFFTSDSAWGLIAAAVIYGISNAGGDVAWSLWVTRFAPPERVAEYMSVHTFLTGVRGVLAPAAAFYCIDRFPVGGLAAGCAILIGLACLVLLPEIRSARIAAPPRSRSRS
jgi:MFS family permease